MGGAQTRLPGGRPTLAPFRTRDRKGASPLLRNRDFRSYARSSEIANAVVVKRSLGFEGKRVKVLRDDGVWVTGRLGSTITMGGTWEGYVYYESSDGHACSAWLDGSRVQRDGEDGKG